MTKNKNNNDLLHTAQCEGRFAGTLGLMTRAGKCVFGTEAVRHGVRTGSVLLVLMDAGLSAASLDSAQDMCNYFETPYMIVKPPGSMGTACGRANKLAGVTSESFANKLLESENISGGVTLEQNKNT